MANVIQSIFGKNQNLLDDQMIVTDMLAMGKAGSMAYFQAALNCVTPEIRRLFIEYAVQAAQGHEALTGLAIQKGWYKAFDEPTQQLQTVYQQSQHIVSQVSQ